MSNAKSVVSKKYYILTDFMALVPSVLPSERLYMSPIREVYASIFRTRSAVIITSPHTMK